ncbi:nicotinate phosphoribosyltransferase [Candidatus Daviesbacteria bacterium]|nr:nicotinate phosphoribosyltransferase [Candidatus Daviesbacteria bacterium]
MNERIINSILWTDLYKLTMGQGVFHRYPGVGASYEFINRGKHKYPKGFGEKLKNQVGMMSDLSLSTSDRKFLEDKCPYLAEDYLDFLSVYRFDPNEVNIKQEGGGLDIDIKGPWARTIYWEVPLMALVCELYYTETNQTPDAGYILRARQKGEMLRSAQALLLEFGTRRAFSHKVHRNVLEALIATAGLLQDGGVLLGTSNIALAKEFNLNPSGTYAHEWVMGHAAIFGNLNANEKAMEVWAREYLGFDGGIAYPKLGTALIDTYTAESFLHDLTLKMAKYFTFFRQDSGDPIEKGIKVVQRLAGLGIDPKSKGVAFTDGLNIPRAIKINEYFKGSTQRVFGIGGDLTNDVGVQAMNIVIKAYSFILPDGHKVQVCKLSDDRGKESGDPKAIEQAKIDFGLQGKR